MTKWTTRNGLYADKYKEKENLVMRINEITNSTEKLELLRLIDAAIWQAMDAESFYADNETEAEQGIAATPTANQAIAPKPAAMQKPTTPVKKLTQQQQAHVKTLDHKQLLNYIKTNLKAPAPATPTKAAPKPVASINPNTNNNQSNSSFDTVNAKDDAAKYKNGESDRLA
jgi:type II secretory pathway pseudopilin PulG